MECKSDAIQYTHKENSTEKAVRKNHNNQLDLIGSIIREPKRKKKEETHENE